LELDRRYPAARYHATLPARVVQNEDEDKAATEAGYANTPFPPPPPPPPVLTPIEELKKQNASLVSQNADLVAFLTSSPP
jgi:hypothetical protein